MRSSESSNDSLLFIKYRKIPKVSKELGGILKFQRVHKLRPSSSPILSKYESFCSESVTQTIVTASMLVAEV